MLTLVSIVLEGYMKRFDFIKSIIFGFHTGFEMEHTIFYTVRPVLTKHTIVLAVSVSGMLPTAF